MPRCINCDLILLILTYRFRRKSIHHARSGRPFTRRYHCCEFVRPPKVSFTESHQIGIVVGLISTSVQSLGLTLQRQSHLREDEKEYEDRKPAWKRPRWQAGMLMFVSSNLIGSTIQITTLPLPVLSTLQASGLVFNTAFATLLLKEPFTRYSAAGTVLTCAGAALIATFGAVGEPAHNLQQLIDLLKKRSFILWMSGTMLAAILTIVLAHMLKVYSSHKHIIRNWFDKIEDRPPSSSGSPSRIKRQFTVFLPRPMQLRLTRLRIIRGMSYAFISGILSAHSLLVAKSAVELIVRTVVDHVNQFNRYESWLILVALVFFSLSQLYYLHLGLRLCSTSVLYPFVFCIYNVIAILDGLIYFQQASRLSGLDAGLVALGTVVLLAGVLALSWRLDETSLEDPTPPSSSISASISAATSLAPGVGAIRASEDLAASPVSSRRASVADERAPLLQRRSRARTVDFQINLPETNSRDIWAALDDQDDADGDFLASLPKTPSPFLKPRKKRPISPTSPAMSSDSEQSISEAGSSTLKPNTTDHRRKNTRRSSMKGARSASAGHADRRDDEGQSTTTRRRGNTVHFEEAVFPSRFDISGKSHDRRTEDRSGDKKDDNG